MRAASDAEGADADQSTANILRALGFAVNEHIGRAATIDEVIAYCERVGSAARRTRLRDRRRGHQGRRSRRAREARVRSRAIRAGRSRISSSRARRARNCCDIVDNGRTHRNAQPERRARAGADRRRDGQERDAAQRRVHRKQRHSHRRPRPRARAGDVIPRVVGPIVAERTGKERRFKMPDALPGLRLRRSTIPKVKRCRAAPTRRVRRRSTNACAILHRAARWISRDLATCSPSS